MNDATPPVILTHARIKDQFKGHSYIYCCVLYVPRASHGKDQLEMKLNVEWTLSVTDRSIQWTVPQLLIMIIYNCTLSILIQYIRIILSADILT